MLFSKKEWYFLGISSLILAFVFGFDDGRSTFQIGYWLLNLVGLFIILAISLVFRELIVKLMAERHNSKSEFGFWFIDRVWFSSWGKLKKPLPIGILLSLVLIIGSAGNIVFTAINNHKLKIIKSARVGRKHTSLKYGEEGKIMASGILANLFLIVIGVLIGRIFGVSLDKFIHVNFFIALFNMLPISSLDGAKIFFGSLLGWIFLVIFVIASFFLVKWKIILGLVLAFLLAIIVVFWIFWRNV